MIKFTPIDFYQFADMGDVEGPAILFAREDSGAVFLITGGEKSDAIWVAGDNVGRGFDQSLGTSWSGLAVTNVAFEVDQASAFYPADGARRRGALSKKRDVLAITGEFRGSNGFKETCDVGIGTRAPRGTDQTVSFSRWRAVVRQDDVVHEIFVFDTEAVAAERAA